MAQLALCCMSHSPLLNLPGPSAELLDDITGALARARAFVADFDPELVVIFSPDHYNGFFYRLMPPFCIGTAASGVGDYGTHSGAAERRRPTSPTPARPRFSTPDVDVAISASMDVDHGTVQPLQALFGDATAVPVIPIFINSVATPLGPIRRVRALGAAIGDYLATLDKRVLVVGSGGLSHDPPVPTLATAPPAALDRIVARCADEPRAARRAADRGDRGGPRLRPRRRAALQPLNPDWDHAFLDLLDTGRLADVDAWTNSWIAATGRQLRARSPHLGGGLRRAGGARGPIRPVQRYYRPAPELIAGFAIRTAVPV